jgi:hypothetical protein
MSKSLGLPKTPYTQANDFDRSFEFDLDPKISPVNPVVDESYDSDDCEPDEETEFETDWKVCAKISFDRSEPKLSLNIRTEKSINDYECDQRVYKRYVRYVESSAVFDLDETELFSILVAVEKMLVDHHQEMVINGQDLTDVVLSYVGELEKYKGSTDLERFAIHLIKTLELKAPLESVERAVSKRMKYFFSYL